MAEVMTYTSLLAELKRYLERGDDEDTTVVAELPHLISNSERSLADKLKIQGYQNTVVNTMAAGTSVYAKPDGWRRTISINFGSGTNHNTRNPLLARSYEYIRSYWPNDTEVGLPLFYADYDYQHFLVGPTPADAYPFELLYWQLPDLLSDANQTNWLTQYAPFLLLYEVLMASGPFLKNDSRIGTWKLLRDEQLAAITSEDLQRVVDRATSRTTS